MPSALPHLPHYSVHPPTSPVTPKWKKSFCLLFIPKFNLTHWAQSKLEWMWKCDGKNHEQISSIILLKVIQILAFCMIRAFFHGCKIKCYFLPTIPWRTSFFPPLSHVFSTAFGSGPPGIMLGWQTSRELEGLFLIWSCTSASVSGKKKTLNWCGCLECVIILSQFLL